MTRPFTASERAGYLAPSYAQEAALLDAYLGEGPEYQCDGCADYFQAGEMNEERTLCRGCQELNQ